MTDESLEDQVDQDPQEISPENPQQDPEGLAENELPESGALREQLGDQMQKAATPEDNKDPKIEEYISKTLEGEARITTPIDPNCKVSVVIPAYGEREYLFKNLESLARQEGVDLSEYEVIIVVNNPPEEPQRESYENDADYERKIKTYEEAIHSNQETLEILKTITSEESSAELTNAERSHIEVIKSSGLNLHIIDKASQGKTLPKEIANVGGARNRGVAEAVERFYGLGRDGVIAQTDADSTMKEDYIRELINAYEKDPELIGVAGQLEFERDISGQQSEEYQELIALANSHTDFSYLYDRLVRKITKKPQPQKESTTDVSFSGANMSSRAFAAARVGGVPEIAGGEDPGFSDALLTIGKVERSETIITKPVRRFSARTDVRAGHGQRLLKFAEKLRGGDAKFKTIEWIEFQNNLQDRVFEAVSQGELTPEILRPIVTFGDKQVLKDKEIKYICDLAKEKNILDPQVAAADRKLAKIRGKLLKTLETEAEQTDLKGAFGQLEERFKKGYPELQQEYELLIEDTMLDIARFDFIRSNLKDLFASQTGDFSDRQVLLTALQNLDPEKYAELNKGPTTWENSHFMGEIASNLKGIDNPKEARTSIEELFGPMSEMSKSSIKDQVVKIWVMEMMLEEGK